MEEHRLLPRDWEEATRPVERAQVIVGGPGTGKTEFLVRRALALVSDGVSPDQILFLSFSRRGAADLQRRFEAGLGGSHGGVRSSTFHAFAHGVLEFHGDAIGWNTMPSLLTSTEQVAIVRELLSNEDEKAWSPAYRTLLKTNTFAREVADFSLRADELLLTPADISQRQRDEWKGLDGFLDRYRAHLNEISRIDYGGLQASATRLLLRTGAGQTVASGAPYVLVDEYQDTTRAQSEMLVALHTHGSRVTAAGDPYQSIFSFRGTDINNISDFPSQFADAESHPAERMILEQSFRTPAAILDGAVRLTAEAELPGSAGPVTPSEHEGIVEAYLFDQLSAESAFIAREIQRLHIEGETPYSRIAVFVRSKRRFLSELSRALEHRGIAHRSPDTRLADHPAIRGVFDIVRAAVEQERHRSQAIPRVLLGPLFGRGIAEIRQLERAYRDGVDWLELLAGHDDFVGLAELLTNRDWATAGRATEGFWHMWQTLPQFQTLATHDTRREERAALASLSQILGRLSDRDPEASLADFVEWSEQEDFEAQPLLDYRMPGADMVTLTTLHQAKGLEFDYVFIADAVESVFPDLRPRESLLGSRHLSDHLPADPVDYRRFRLQEESRLAYTAMTRARLRVTWTATVTGGELGDGVASRFMEAAAGTVVPAPSDRNSSPITAQEAEAWLRRRVSDPAEPASKRLAALSSLVDPGSHLRSPNEFAGIAPRTRPEQLQATDQPIHLSPTRAASYEECPRRFAHEHKLLLGEETNVYLALGNLVHEVLELTEAEALDRGLPNGDLATALEFLEMRFRPAQFGGPPWSESWKQRAATLISNAYELRPHPGSVTAATELRITSTGDGATWSGRVDLVQVQDGQSRLVDYKTGTALTVDEAAESLQLGYYVTAFRDYAREHGLDPASEAEFWFLKGTTKDSVVTRQFEPENLPAITQRMDQVARDLAANDWTPRPGSHCQRCIFRLACPAWPEGRWAFSWT